MPRITRQAVLDKIAGAKQDLRRMHVTRLELFGSVARNEADETSDVDLLVEFEPEARISLFDFAEVEEYLERLLGCKVELVMRHCVIPELRERIYGEAIRVA